MQAPLASGAVFTHDAFMGRGLAAAPAADAGLGGLDDVPFGLLMSSVLTEWGVPFNGAPAAALGPPVAAPAALPAPLPPAPPAQAAGAAPLGLRCLDPAHGRACAECTAAPLDGEDGALAFSQDLGATAR
jgi:hypothetical protein